MPELLKRNRLYLICQTLSIHCEIHPIELFFKKNSMKFGFRKISISKSIAAKTSMTRIVKDSLGLKAPRGFGWLTNPRKAMYNKVYNKTSVSIFSSKFWNWFK